MNTKNSSPEKFVRAHHRARQAGPLLALLAGGLAVTLDLLWILNPSFAPVTDWGVLRPSWLGGIATTLLGAGILWHRRRRPLLRSAAEMDERLATHNRLEAATAGQSATDPLARAQREETERFLQQAHLTPRRRWVPVLAALAALLAAAHVFTLVCWTRPVHRDLSAQNKLAAPEAGIKKVDPAPPAASIEWHSPESETAATAIEEVPLEAEADSATGLRNAVLEVEVNGEHRLSQPVTDDLTQAGRHTLKPSIYLDQLEVKTFDIVSYHLSAQRIAVGDLPPTSSTVQFVQVKPMRDDTFVCAGGDQPTRCFNYVTALKAAQLRLMKDNFTLAHAEVRHDNDEWRSENSRVGDAQGQLALRAADVIELMTTNHYPEEILGLVRESRPLMEDADQKIVHEENQPALAPQGRALGYLTEVEKYLKNSIKLAGQNKQEKPNDPFQKPKNLELKNHPLTRAGKIDALAAAQTQLAGDLAAGNTNSTMERASGDATSGAEEIAGSPSQRQTEIKQRLDEFLSDPGFNPDALKHLQSGDDLAGQSEQRIDNDDFNAASEPAAEAARELRLTAAALRADGNRTAKNELADALLRLSAAAGNVRQAAQAKTDAEATAELKKSGDAVREAAQQLAAEAGRQQENGATNASARLAEMAKLLSSESLQQLQAQAEAAPRDAGRGEALAQKLAELAEQAGKQRNPGPLSRQDLARLLDDLQRTQANLNHLATQCSGAAPGQTAKPGGQTAGSAASATAEDKTAHARGPEPGRAEAQQAELMQLLDNLRLARMDLRTGSGKTFNFGKLDGILNAGGGPESNPLDIASIAAEIDPPLTGVIHSLQAALAGMRRPYQLASQETSPAPPAYRAAVADYFERVSQDYPSTPDAAETRK